MIGANAAMGNANAAIGNGLVGERRHGLLERLVRRYREHAARTRADHLARMSWTEEPRHEPAGPGREFLDAGATPVRWTRLT
jgi:hypothetical protein